MRYIPGGGWEVYLCVCVGVQMKQQAVLLPRVIVGETGHTGTQALLGVIREGFPEAVILTLRSGLISQLRWSRRIPFCLTVWYGNRKRSYTGDLLSTHFLGVDKPQSSVFPKNYSHSGTIKILLCLHKAVCKNQIWPFVPRGSPK